MLLARAALSVIAMMGIADAQARPAFEVSPGTGKPGIVRTPLEIAFQATHVGDIIAFAYDLPIDRIERRPQWMYDDLYNVAVTTETPVGVPELKLMLQKLLEERFGLVVHRVSNQSPVYFLTARPNLNLTAAAENDPTALPDFRVTTPLQLVVSGAPKPVCIASHVSMSDLAAWLYPRLQLPVLDKTGITGLFDFEISGLPVRGGSEGTIQAVRNSLGLDFELHHGTAESLIVDHAEKPKTN
jgi:uncharacterized protein (TIGR03435 family)